MSFGREDSAPGGSRHAVRSNANCPALHPAKFVGVARMIAGKDSPELAPRLYACARLVAPYAESDAVIPKRRDTQERLRKFGENVAKITAALENNILFGFLDHALPEGISLPEAYQVLDDLSARAKLELDRIQRGGGRGLAHPLTRGGAPDIPPVAARAMAALVVIIAWKHVRGAEPGADNDEALDAVNAFWTAITGQGAQGWRRYFIAAKDLRDAWKGTSNTRGAVVREFSDLLTGRRDLLTGQVLNLFEAKPVD